MKKLLALYDDDSIYAGRLMEYLKHLGWEDFDILLFTRQESLTDFLKYQPIEILLYGNDSFPEEIAKNNIKYIFNLCKNQADAGDDLQQIFKYQAAGKIASDIISCYTKLEDFNAGRRYDDVGFISVYPPVPGAEKISFAWALAKELSDKRKTLFISMEMFPAEFLADGRQTGYALSEYLYFLKECRTGNAILKSYLNYSEKLSCLSGVSHGFDLLALGKDDAERFMKELREHKDYEIVIFYLGLYTEATMEIMKNSDRVFLLSCKEPYEEMVLGEWERQMELMGIARDPSKYLKIKLPTVEQAAGENCSFDHLYPAIRPYAKDLSKHLLYGERSSYELAKGKTAAGSA